MASSALRLAAAALLCAASCCWSSVLSANDDGRRSSDAAAGNRRAFGALSSTEVQALRAEVRAQWARAAAAAAGAGQGGGSCGDDGVCASDVGDDRGAVSIGALVAETFGDCQAERLLLPALRFTFEGSEKDGVILDIGAYVGRWTAAVLSEFGRLEHKKYAKEYGDEGSPCPAPAGPSVTIFCLEPVQANFNRLQERAKRSAWQLEDVKFMRAGAANATGKKPLWTTGGAFVDAKASLTARDGVSSSLEKMVTIDTLLKKSVSGGRAFLLRLATNGHEHGALIGAKKSLKNRTVRFVLFEESPLSTAAGYALKDSIAFLWKLSYACFALLPSPVVISGPFWQEAAALTRPARFWIFCGHVSDPALRRTLRALDPDSPDILRPATPAASAS